MNAAPAPAIILVRPQLAENVGTTARAMLNCGLVELRLVEPREDWLCQKAVAASSGADAVLKAARAFSSTEEAIADLHRVYATTGRNRFMVKPVVTPRQAAAELRAHVAGALNTGVLFGPERTGLENDDVSLADVVITVPLNPDYCSLNLAQSVLLVGYEWFQAGDPAEPRAMTKGAAPVADKAQLIGFFQHLERELDDCGFFRVGEKRPSMVRNIRNMFERADLTQQELRTLHGIIHELVTFRKSKG
ncbi:MAG TPA: RNA methyltransferase [Rhodospirillaceae bacterium]|nr:RNA methyltransferase [Rhodospirillaceae bacterium]